MFRSFRGTIYAKTPRGLMVYDADEFRPVEKIVWNPVRRRVEPLYGAFCHELFDSNYGYGDDPTLKTHCASLELGDAPEILIPEDFWRWTGQPMEWILDRPVVLHPCVRAVERSDYLRIMNVRARTLKRIPRQIRGTIKQQRR